MCLKLSLIRRLANETLTKCNPNDFGRISDTDIFTVEILKISLYTTLHSSPLFFYSWPTPLVKKRKLRDLAVLEHFPDRTIHSLINVLLLIPTNNLLSFLAGFCYPLKKYFYCIAPML